MKKTRRDFLKVSLASVAAGATQLYAQPSPDYRVPKRKFGRHDEYVSVIGIGGHTLHNAGSQAQANAIVDKAIAHGINFFDNSWDYVRGNAEKVMGIALEGKRDQAFLMSKFCNFHQNAYTEDVAGAMKSLEDSLTRLKTDHLDLWLMHNVSGDDLHQAYKPDGAIEALELAKKQGKVRYTGFSGHTSAQLHRELIEGGYPWDAILMPISVVGARKSRDFETDTVPLCAARGIAVIGMKGFGGAERRDLHGRATPKLVLGYSLSYPQVCTHLIGLDRLEFLEQAIAASSFEPMSPSDRAQYAANDGSIAPDDLYIAQSPVTYESGSCCDRQHHGEAHS